MTLIEPLTTDRLRRRCDVDDLPFDYTGELTPMEGFLGQDRAITARRFGVEIEHDSYHLFALDPSGLGKHEVVQRLLAERASQRQTPSNWRYVHNFDEPHRSKAIEDAGQRRQEEAFEALQAGAKVKDVALVRTPVGMALAPLRGEEAMKPSNN